jgi:hypothetical protein
MSGNEEVAVAVGGMPALKGTATLVKEHSLLFAVLHVPGLYFNIRDSIFCGSIFKKTLYMKKCVTHHTHCYLCLALCAPCLVQLRLRWLSLSKPA